MSDQYNDLVPLEIALPKAVLEAVRDYQKKHPHLNLNTIALMGISHIVYGHPHA